MPAAFARVKASLYKTAPLQDRCHWWLLPSWPPDGTGPASLLCSPSIWSPMAENNPKHSSGLLPSLPLTWELIPVGMWHSWLPSLSLLHPSWYLPGIPCASCSISSLAHAGLEQGTAFLVPRCCGAWSPRSLHTEWLGPPRPLTLHALGLAVPPNCSRRSKEL